MADYADNASLSSSRPERSAPSKLGASSPSFDVSDTPVIADSAADAVQALAGEGAPTPQAEGAVRQATLTGFEAPQPVAAVSAPGDEASVAGAVAAATTARRAARTKRGAAAGSAEAAQPNGGTPDEALTGAEASEPAVSMPPQMHAAPNEDAKAFAGAETAQTAWPQQAYEAAAIDADAPERVEPASFPHEAAQPPALAQRLDALQSALAEQQRMAAASSRQLKWVLAAASAALLASVGFGIAQSVRLDSLSNESRADQARLEQFLLKQQSSLDDLTQRVATPPAAPVAVEAPPAAPARAAAAPAAPAPKRHAAARPAQKPHASRTQKASH
jgi:hypothetical protein